MKEDTLRGMIRKQIKTSLKESPIARTQVGAKLGSIEKMAGVKMLKKALGQGTPAQQAAGLLQVVQAISGNNPATAKMLARMIMKKGIAADEPTAPVSEDMSSALKSKKGRVDATQAMKMMKSTLATKPATQQTDFVVALINDLGLKDSAKKRLLLKLRKGLE